MPIKASETEFNGHPMLVLEWDGREPDKRPFRLGLGNAKRVLEATEQIRAFVIMHRNDPKRPSPAVRSGTAAVVQAMVEAAREAIHGEDRP